MGWEVIHYWLLIQDNYNGVAKHEWVQFVIHKKTQFNKLVVPCRVLVRHNDANGKPGKILSNWKGSLEEGRKLWQHYVTKQCGEYRSEMTEIRNDQSFTPGQTVPFTYPIK